jgi:phage tail tape-measure protein
MIDMRKFLFFTLVLGLMVASLGCGPGYRTQQGAIVGAAVGALAGHDIGEDTESTLIGAAIGGVTGAVVGDAIEQYEYDNGRYQYNYPVYEQRLQYNQKQAPTRRY